MSILRRRIFPVAHGGMALEEINGFRVLYDCGSQKSEFAKHQINKIFNEGINKIDCLTISHFDTDHVNSVGYLLDRIPVHNVMIPIVPNEYRLIYDSITQGAYNSIMEMFEGSNITIGEPNTETGEYNEPFSNLWEWIGKSLLTQKDFIHFANVLQKNGFDLKGLNDPFYIYNNRKVINTCFKNAFGASGPNEKGLIMLSQPTNRAELLDYSPRAFLNHFCQNHNSCLYTGDTNLKEKGSYYEVRDFYENKRNRNDGLLFMQVPHHGSSNNSDHRLMNFEPCMFFVNDDDINRFEKNKLSEATDRFFIAEKTDLNYSKSEVY